VARPQGIDANYGRARVLLRRFLAPAAGDAPRRVEHVRDNGARRRQASGAATLEQHSPRKVALDLHGVENAIDLRERLVLADECRVDAYLDATVRGSSQGKELDLVAEFLGVL